MKGLLGCLVLVAAFPIIYWLLMNSIIAQILFGIVCIIAVLSAGAEIPVADYSNSEPSESKRNQDWYEDKLTWRARKGGLNDYTDGGKYKDD